MSGAIIGSNDARYKCHGWSKNKDLSSQLNSEGIKSTESMEVVGNSGLV